MPKPLNTRRLAEKAREEYWNADGPLGMRQAIMELCSENERMAEVVGAARKTVADRRYRYGREGRFEGPMVELVAALKELVADPCPICGSLRCVYKRMPMDVGETYFINDVEVTMAEYVAEERRCGFFNTLGHPEMPATAAFTGADGTHGRCGRW